MAELRIPSLGNRAEDIVTLFEFFAKQQCENFGTQYQMVNNATRKVLLSYKWPGNVRELINVATRYAIQNCGNIESAIEIDTQNTFDIDSNESLKEMVHAYEEKLIRSKLAQHNGKVSLVLDELYLERRTFNQKLNKYGISTSDYKNSTQ